MAANDTLVLTASADGDAQFTVDVNGQQVGGTYDVTAAHGTGQTAANTQDITLTGDFSSSQPTQIAVNFLDQATADLYIESVNFDGTVVQGNQAVMNPASVNPTADPNAAVMFEDGTATFTVSGSTTGSGGTGTGTGGTGGGTSGGNTPPTASLQVAQEQTIGPNQTVALSSLFSANEPDGDPITQYQIYEGSFGAPVGTITDANGNVLPTFQVDTVTSLAGLNYNSSTSAGMDRISFQAFADGQWSNWVWADMNNTGGVAPTSSLQVAQEQTIGPNQTVALSSLFSTTEPDGDPITQYNIYEGSFGTPVGTITDANGNVLPTFQYDNVSSLTGLTYNSGASAGMDRITYQGYADGKWSNWVYVDMNNTGDPPGGGSTGGGTGPISMVMSADGDAQFTVNVNGPQAGGIFDVTAAHGTGTTAANTQTVTLPGDFSTTGPLQVTVNFLNAATADLYIESISADGQTIQGNQAVLDPGAVNAAADPSSAVLFENGTATFTINGTGSGSGSGGGTGSGNTPPTASLQVAQEQTIGPNQTVALSSLFAANEPDGDPITQYQIYEGSFGTPVGTITDANGNVVPTFTYDTVTSLAGLNYNSGTSPGMDRISFQAFADGQWSNWVWADMNNTGGVAPTSSLQVAQEQTVGPSQTVAISSLFAANESDGDAITQYQLYEGSFGTPVGTITDANGNVLPTFAYDTVTSLAGLNYNSSTNAGTDRISFRAYADGQWSNWVWADMNNTGGSGSGSGGGSGGTGPISMVMSADGDAQFTVDVNGQQVGGIYDVTAAHGTGTTAANTQTVTLPGDFSTAGPLQVAVNFTNDPVADLYIESITADGQTIQGNQAAMTPASVNPAADPNAAVMFENGTATFNIAPLVQSMAGTTNSGSGGTTSGGGQVTDQSQAALATSHG